MLDSIERKLGLQIDRTIFGGASAIILAVIAFSVVAAEEAEAVWKALYVFTSGYFGWLYLLAVALFLGLCLYLAISPLSKIRLGADDEEPAYPFFSWLAMLFSAGMGIGLVFNCVAEPVAHFQSPPVDALHEDGQAAQAMKLTYLHWGLHAWSIYVVVGLSVAYFHFRKGLPLSLRHTLSPILPKRVIEGPLGKMIDVLAVVGTLFGVAASLGYGSAQITTGLNHVFSTPKAPWFQVVVIASITAVALVAVVSGLDYGIKYLSQLNVAFAAILLAFVLSPGRAAWRIRRPCRRSTEPRSRGSWPPC